MTDYSIRPKQRCPTVTSLSAVLLILATILLTYSLVFASDYGFSDDFCFLAIRPLNTRNITEEIHHFCAEGRCLFPIWELGLMGQVNAIQGLKYIRLITLWGVFFSSLVFYKLIRRHFMEGRLDASLLACIFSINPSFLIMTSWAQAGSDAYACFFGLLSSHVLLRADCFNVPSSKSNSESEIRSISGWRWRRLFLSGILLFAALSLYQPGGMFYWTGVAIWIIGRFMGRRQDWMNLIRIILVFIGVLCIYFAFVHQFAETHSRFKLSISITHRIGWFIIYPLANALCYPWSQPFTLWSIVALFILSFGIWLFCRQTFRSMWIPCLILIMMPLTVLPTTFAYNHYDVTRARPALYCLIIILWYVTLKSIIFTKKNLLTLRQILIPVLIALIVFSQYQLERYFIIPQLREESALLIKLEEYSRENPKLDRLIVLLPPSRTHLMTEFPGIDDMGIASLTQPWADDPEIRIILAGITNQHIEDIAGTKILAIYYDDRWPPGAFVINFRQLRAPH